jgi:hypothetical protein
MTKTIQVSDETYEKIKSQLQAEEQKEIKNLDDLVGETYCFQCARYIYHGKVKSVNSDYIQLENAGVVFETGEYSSSSPLDRQELPNGVQVMRNAIESFFKLKW